MLKFFLNLSKKNTRKTVGVIFIIYLVLFSFISFKYVSRSYNDYIYGKFDLGNVNQMLYNSTRGFFMSVTDQFGSNVPRWSMSHIDPSILIFMPINLVFTDAFVLLIFLVLCFSLSSVLSYLISLNEKLTYLQAFMVSSLIFLFPISGYILVWTGFRPLVLAMPFLLLLYYILQKIEYSKLVKHKNLCLIIFYISVLIFILSKEELGFVLFAFLPHLYKKFKKMRFHLVVSSVFSFLWSVFSFVYLIPAYTLGRSQSLEGFSKYIGVNPEKYYYLFSSNFFLHRYEQFGDSYVGILVGIILHPLLFVQVFLKPEVLSTLFSLFAPILFSILFSPLVFLAALPEILIHGITGDPTVFSIENHRLLAVVPILIISVISFVKYLNTKKNLYFSYVYLILVLFFSVGISYYSKSPLLYTVYERIKQTVYNNKKVFAEINKKAEWNYNLDPKCADYIVSKLLPNDKVSVPQPLGAKTSNRYYNALYPTGLNKSNVVVVDVLERKVTDFLELNFLYNKKALNKYVTDSTVEITTACNRLFMLKKAEKSNYTVSYSTYISKEKPLFTYLYKDEDFFKIYDLNISKMSDKRLQVSYNYSFDWEPGRDQFFGYTILESNENKWSFIHVPSYFSNIYAVTLPNNIINETFDIEIPEYIRSKPGMYTIYFGIGTNAYTKNNIKVGEIKL
ncbi:hypothetical protein COV24_01980 [candidate division WWE3 bacterium CG10_big_fil_rev_8_21_14_0_10_32_10]|uniref:DUF2079 domain-containing protein n=1 Tax=candidate division WWE3 bacterium CG10_big_fil_rev_8_21_14_0_10_32_10 TaxID=1975090 RepID=A0A2H0RAL9_UNCKA|nr:MAG: hypothetical protein COV24_01980 [candidate division WWE3 bacterium CG10_big_fil_rev_8_21_14_0_10_32_10]